MRVVVGSPATSRPVESTYSRTTARFQGLAVVRHVDKYPERRVQVAQALKAAHKEGVEFEEALVGHFFPHPTDWDVSIKDFDQMLKMITPSEIEEVIEDLGLRSDKQIVFQCQHCGRYFDVNDAILAWVVDYDRSTSDPDQLVVVPSAACGTSCQRQIRANSFRLVT